MCSIYRIPKPFVFSALGSVRDAQCPCKYFSRTPPSLKNVPSMDKNQLWSYDRFGGLAWTNNHLGNSCQFFALHMSAVKAAAAPTTTTTTNEKKRCNIRASENPRSAFHSISPQSPARPSSPSSFGHDPWPQRARVRFLARVCFRAFLEPKTTPYWQWMTKTMTWIKKCKQTETQK